MELLNNLYQNPELVILDYDPKNVISVDLLLSIKKFNPNIHIVVASGQSDMDIAIQFLKCGAFDYVIKDGFYANKIPAVIDKWLKGIEFNESLETSGASEDDDKHVRTIIEAQEKIRREISLQLHENVNQLLGVSRLYVETAYSDEVNRVQLLMDSKTAINAAIVEIKKLSLSLQPKKIREYNLEEDIPKLITNLMMLDKFTVLSNLNIKGLKEVLAAQKHQDILEIMQSLINLIIKFSNAKRVLLGLTLCDNELHLLLTDDGVGYNLEKAEKPFGFLKIYDQIKTLKGEYAINTAPGKGCRWNIHFPL
jgi:signal transduction histidine kinase